MRWEGKEQNRRGNPGPCLCRCRLSLFLLQAAKISSFYWAALAITTATTSQLSSCCDMAEELEVGEFWLPPELLEDGFAVEKEELQPGEAPVEVAVGMERDGEEEDYMDGLTRRMTQSFLQDDKEEEEAKMEAAWPSSWEQWKGDEWTLFQETGGWVAASAKLNWGPRRQCPEKNSVPGRCFAAPLNAHYHWDAARVSLAHATKP